MTYLAIPLAKFCRFIILIKGQQLVNFDWCLVFRYNSLQAECKKGTDRLQMYKCWQVLTTLNYNYRSRLMTWKTWTSYSFCMIYDVTILCPTTVSWWDMCDMRMALIACFYTDFGVSKHNFDGIVENPITVKNMPNLSWIKCIILVFVNRYSAPRTGRCRSAQRAVQSTYVRIVKVSNAQ